MLLTLITVLAEMNSVPSVWMKDALVPSVTEEDVPKRQLILPLTTAPTKALVNVLPLPSVKDMASPEISNVASPTTIRFVLARELLPLEAKMPQLIVVGQR